MQMTASFLCLVIVSSACGVSLWNSGSIAADEESPTVEAGSPRGPGGQRAQAVEQLQPLGMLVGNWRGVGQPQRGSRTGAWIEKARCEWRFGDDQAELVLRSDAARQFELLSLGYHPDSRTMTASIRRRDSDAVQSYVRDVESSRDAVDVFVDSGEPDEARNRMTLRRLSDIRVTLLFEKRRTASGSWRRVAEIGYTRAGERLAAPGSGAPECIVTGGLGSLTVTHKGKTYHVCCSGCRQAFEADPEGTIAAWRERIAQRDAGR